MVVISSILNTIYNIYIAVSTIVTKKFVAIQSNDVNTLSFPRDYCSLVGWELAILVPSPLAMLAIATSFIY